MKLNIKVTIHDLNILKKYFNSFNSEYPIKLKGPYIPMDKQVRTLIGEIVRTSGILAYLINIDSQYKEASNKKEDILLNIKKIKDISIEDVALEFRLKLYDIDRFITEEIEYAQDLDIDSDDLTNLMEQFNLISESDKSKALESITDNNEEWLKLKEKYDKLLVLCKKITGHDFIEEMS